jgi:cysteine-rich repeat protein
VAGDGCADCRVEACGNGRQDPGEECDSGDPASPGPRDTAECNKDCTRRRCGDGYVNEALDANGKRLEDCDNGAENGDDLYDVAKACTHACKWAAACGDAFIDSEHGEECDPKEGTQTADCNFGQEARVKGVACKLTACGDGYANTTPDVDGHAETCDPGIETAECNLSKGRHLDTDCQPALCGDEYRNKAAGEQCDDGDAAHDSDDQLNEDANSVYGHPERCTTDCQRAHFCGDGIPDTGLLDSRGEPLEECDDGDADHDLDGDGVINGRATELYGLEGRCTDECKLAPYCGDGRLDDDLKDENGNPRESCDDGNRISGDTCSDTCRNATCGNGITEPGEECDDGNDDNEDGCIIVKDRGEPGAAANCRWNVCGDGFTNKTSSKGQPVEACDGGSLDDRAADETTSAYRWVAIPADTEECDADCTLAVCGDAHTNPRHHEACDDGGASAECNANCTLPGCGDGFVTGSEECDPEAADEGWTPENCDADCTRTTCGDGFVNNTLTSDGSAVEECDPGTPSSTGDASPQDTPLCTKYCKASFCGDGHLNKTVEECDPGGVGVASADCTPFCKAHRCGDFFVGPNEECDSGGHDTSACDEDCSAAKCGDGHVNRAAGEQCDDSNFTTGDGCDATCKKEVDYAWHCPGEVDGGGGGKCWRCGDAKQHRPEETCDDGNAASGDGCSADCQRETNYVWHCPTVGQPCYRCGDHHTDPGEQCDDGNQDDGDGCSSVCATEP